MRVVSSEEASDCFENLTTWAKSDKPLLGLSLGEWVYHRKLARSDKRIDQVFDQVKNKTGISREVLCSNKARRGNYYEARKYAAKLLRSDLNLSNFDIGKILGLSASTVNLYLEVTSDWYSGDYAEVQKSIFTEG
jgi:chromosomal replication initiation ATPase DnaA